MPQSELRLVQYSGLQAETTMSPPCGKVHMALRFKGLEYDVVNLGNPGQTKRYNPRGRVPVLLFGEEAVVDSTDILDTLEQRFPSPPMNPSAPADLARARIWEDWADEVLYFYGAYLRWCCPENFARLKANKLGQLPFPLRLIIPYFAKRMVHKRFHGQGVGLKSQEVVHRELRTCLESLETVLQDQTWLAGPEISRGDLAVAAVIDQLRVETLTPWSAQQVSQFPAILAWLQKVHQKAPCASDAGPLPESS
ncbi:MAG: glutathione S-transferase family protein [Planctomycetota bacterium]|nr:MAG: glutathione S-transferase family protein [Planctomycetota bacterium]